MIKTHQIHLHPTPEQENYLMRAAGTNRFLYNWGLNEWKAWYQDGKKPSGRKLRDYFRSEVRDKEFPWVNDVAKDVLEGAFDDLQDAFNRFFNGQNRYPKSKKRSRGVFSFNVRPDQLNLNPPARTGHRYAVRIPRLGWVNMTESFKYPDGEIKTVRVKKHGKWWYINITVELSDEVFPEPFGASIGMDLGVRYLATLSTGEQLENQKCYQKQLQKIRRLSRELSRKQEGSKNQVRAKERLRQAHHRIVLMREDWMHKVTHRLTHDYGFIGIEDLNIKGMMQSGNLSRAIADASMGKFIILLRSKAQTNGCIIQEVDRWYPSSKLCSVCGEKHPDLKRGDTLFVCPHCGYTADRDVNAAQNIHQEALRLYNHAQLSRQCGYDET